MASSASAPDFAPDTASSGLLIQSAQAEVMEAVDDLLDQLLALPNDQRSRLYEAMRHAAIAGGKRLRPLLVRASAELYGVDPMSSLRVGAAVEAIHVYSLIHDDLPCMDDDDMRRGKPTVHRAFDEATAVLAGDSLHALAFEWLADEATHADPLIRIAVLRELAQAAGPDGMAGGQMMDLEAEKSDFDLAVVTKLQELKTGALISFSVEAGAILAGVSASERAPLRQYARDIGLAFQIADDILDVEGDAELAGKALQKDEAAGKETFVSIMGLDGAKAEARRLVDHAIAQLDGFGEEGALLRAIARYVVERDR
jgi:farnesyl diphosphate synthase